MKVSGYVKDANNFAEGCVSGVYAHADAGENWSRFETTTSKMKEPTGYMAVHYSGGSIWLVAMSYDNNEEIARKKAIASGCYNVVGVEQVSVQIGDECDN